MPRVERTLEAQVLCGDPSTRSLRLSCLAAVFIALRSQVGLHTVQISYDLLEAQLRPRNA